jgi:hypothetical protein
MASIDELAQRDAEIRTAESVALRGVAKAMRSAILDLPSESRLGLILYRHADTLDLWATGRSSALWTDVTLGNLESDLGELDDESEDDA